MFKTFCGKHVQKVITRHQWGGPELCTVYKESYFFYCTSRENLYQVLQVMCTVSECAIIRMINWRCEVWSVSTKCWSCLTITNHCGLLLQVRWFIYNSSNSHNMYVIDNTWYHLTYRTLHQWQVCSQSGLGDPRWWKTCWNWNRSWILFHSAWQESVWLSS